MNWEGVGTCTWSLTRSGEVATFLLYFTLTVFSLLEKWPLAVREKDDEGLTPLELSRKTGIKNNSTWYSEQVLLKQKCLMCVDKMMADGEMSMDDMNLFLYMKWWNGFFWIIARYPNLT